MRRKNFLSNTITATSNISLLDCQKDEEKYLNYCDFRRFYNNDSEIAVYEKEENRFYGKKIPEMIFISWPKTT